MKRIFALLLAVCLLVLCGCGAEVPENPSEGANSKPGQNSQNTPNNSDDPAAATEASVAEEDLLYRNPLNGQKIAQPYTARPIAVVINNSYDAMPQYGISEADIMYELETEGGISRYMAVFSDLSDVGTVGPIRSARTFFNNIALSYDATLIHCGGSAAALRAQVADNSTRISNWSHVNESYFPQYFFRDNDRYKNGYAWEHTLFSSGGQLIQAQADLGYANHSAEYTEMQTGDDFYGLTFADEINLNGETANTVKVVFRYGKTTTMTYDAETGLYNASQYKQEHMDAAANKCVAYRNVLVLRTTQWSKDDGTYVRSYYDLIGEGSGYFACNGQIIPIKWQREDYRNSFTYTLEDGTPLDLGVGTTYVGITSAKTYVEYE